METHHVITEKLSKYNFETTVERIIDHAKLRVWNVPFVHDLQQSLAKSGKQVKPVKVIEICKPEYSGKMLELNDERIISVMMPCRISVYVKDDAMTYVALINTAQFAKELPVTVANVMKAASDESFEIVKAAIEL